MAVEIRVGGGVGAVKWLRQPGEDAADYFVIGTMRSQKNGVQVWSRQLQRHPTPVCSVAYDYDVAGLDVQARDNGAYLLVGGGRSVGWCCVNADGQQMVRVSEHSVGGGVTAVAIARSEAGVGCVGCEDGALYRVAPDRAPLLHTPHADVGAVRDVCYGPGAPGPTTAGRRLAFWDFRQAAAGAAVALYAPSATEAFECVSVSASGNYVAGGTTGGRVYVWDVRDTRAAAHTVELGTEHDTRAVRRLVFGDRDDHTMLVACAGALLRLTWAPKPLYAQDPDIRKLTVDRLDTAVMDVHGDSVVYGCETGTIGVL